MWAASGYQQLAAISTHFSKLYTDLQLLAQPLIKTPELPKIAIPTRALGSHFSPDLSAWSRHYTAQFASTFDAVRLFQHERLANLLKNIEALRNFTFLPNWTGEMADKGLDQLEQLVLDEGLPLGWVPATPILEKLFSVSSAKERREILGRAWKAIANDCIRVLESISHPQLRDQVGFAKTAARDLLGGRAHGSQALSANLLDTILRTHFDSGERLEIVGKGNKKFPRERRVIDDLPLRSAVVLGGIWGAFGQFWPENGDHVPRNFSRHASAHGVSRRQYSRINALLALMHVTALLKLLSVDYLKQRAA